MDPRGTLRTARRAQIPTLTDLALSPVIVHEVHLGEDELQGRLEDGQPRDEVAHAQAALHPGGAPGPPGEEASPRHGQGQGSGYDEPRSHAHRYVETRDFATAGPWTYKGKAPRAQSGEPGG